MFDQFKDAMRSVQQREGQLFSSREELANRLRSLNEEYAKMITDEALGRDVTEKQLSTKQAEIDRVQKELQIVEERLVAIRAAKRERLAEFLPQLEAEYREIMDKKEAEYREKLKEMRKWKADYLLNIRSLGRMRQEMYKIQEEFKFLASHATDKYERFRPHVEAVNLFSDYSGKDKRNAVAEDEVIDAFNYGTVPLWVKYYELTGEIVFSNSTAEAKLREMKARDE